MNVLEASKKRIARIFAQFDNVYVSFSGGKDSGVMLNLAIQHIRENDPSRKISVFHIDYEAQYQMTTDYVDAVLMDNQDICEVYRICLPLAADCATSMTKSYWIPWDKNDEPIWVRLMPEHEGVINEQNCPFPWFLKGMSDYELQERFSTWLHKKNGATRTACLVGIRTEESQNRWNAIHGSTKREIARYEGIDWTTRMAKDVYNCYPIFDWTTEDVWTANGKFKWSYNKLYDLFYMAGVALGNQRVASPFHSCGTEALKLYKVIDPNNWGKMVGRTNGVNFTGLYGGTTAMGWRSIVLPPGYTWKQYMEFLLTTLPDEVAENYKKKLNFSIQFWQNKGGGLSPEIRSKLVGLNIPHKVGTEARKNAAFKENLPVTMEYLDDIDLQDFRLIPTYKRMCVCIMKNDHTCKFMGFGPTKNETMLRSQAEKKYANL